MFAKKIFMSGNPVKTDSIQVDRIFMIIQECCSNLGRNKLFIEFITMPTDRPCFPRTSKICQFDRSGRAEVEVPKHGRKHALENEALFCPWHLPTSPPQDSPLACCRANIFLKHIFAKHVLLTHILFKNIIYSAN